ncbi:MAG TPA: DUF883 family protein [Verrucomicrobiae bacterium]|jgi:ElaB/YqjD/DUF883 family membrane-anchored ribosome-binding protein|nr:DUF883 family protein [Verrucomicrobiae bacterium]
MTEVENPEQEVTMGKLVQDFKVVMHDAESLLKASAGELGERAREARVRLAASLESARANFQKVEERAVEGARATDRVIREHPYQSIGVAFGIGLLIGVLVTRR